LVQILMKTHTWLTWAAIAIEHEHEAYEARQAQLESSGEQPQFGEALAREMKASLVAMSAAAHALDALYGEVKPSIPIDPALVETWRKNDLAREKWILETLKHGFNVGRYATAWATELVWLFDLRDAAVHPLDEFKPPILHPPSGTNVASVYGAYNCEAATRAIDLLVEVAQVCVDAPRPTLPEIVAWSEGMKKSVASFPERTATN
jgi:hypothetical protein